MSSLPQPASWGRYPRVRQEVRVLQDRFELPRFDSDKTHLPCGLGRSYGDSGLNDGGVVFSSRRLDHHLSFDVEQGIIECEAGVSFDEILRVIVPKGWFLPVTPGTRFVTVGGAIANDVHGKNHHRAGSFGCHLIEFELLRSDGRVLRCSPTSNADWFAATVGGLGLTGLIRTARLRLVRIPGPSIQGEVIRFGRLDEFFKLSRESDITHEYTVAWIDCLASGERLGRGLFTRGNPAPRIESAPGRSWLKIPFTPPLSLVNGLSLRAFNELYYRRQLSERVSHSWHYQPFFYPLDGISEWNRLYGPHGFLQYQCVVPPQHAQASIAEMLARIAHSGQGSFLAVLKTFGNTPSPGMLSFARPGATLALDFPNLGMRTLNLLEQLDKITRAAGGAVYPAKDARMSAESFQQYFPYCKAFEAFIDPTFSSSFWRRVSRTTGTQT